METDFSLNWTEEEKEKSKTVKTCHICGIKKVEPHCKHGFCSGMIDNPNYKQQLEEYNILKKQFEEEEEEVKKEDEEYFEEDDILGFRKPQFN
jgi:hypothetical protein